MKNELEIKRKDGIIVKGKFKFLEEKDIDDIMNLQKTVIDALENKELFAASEKEEFLEYIKVVGKIIGCYESENDELIALTKELTETLRRNKTIDWQKRDDARAKMRMLIKKLLKKHKYPPEGMEDAVKTVMTQWELWTDNVME